MNIEDKHAHVQKINSILFPFFPSVEDIPDPVWYDNDSNDKITIISNKPPNER